MRVRAIQWIGFKAHNTQEQDFIFVSFKQIFLLLSLKGTANQDDIDVSIVLIDDRLERAKLDQVWVGRMRQRRNGDALVC